uniref:Putative phosphoprotein n=1 Tax=Murine feces-associated rhabdovirus TaxID=2171387 RepID=A0A2S0SYX7_9RHAB|nr:putative phosphoprotein [Murine feces-associated rhabdovirus]
MSLRRQFTLNKVPLDERYAWSRTTKLVGAHTLSHPEETETLPTVENLTNFGLPSGIRTSLLEIEQEIEHHLKKPEPLPERSDTSHQEFSKRVTSSSTLDLLKQTMSESAQGESAFEKAVTRQLEPVLPEEDDDQLQKPSMEEMIDHDKIDWGDDVSDTQQEGQELSDEDEEEESPKEYGDNSDPNLFYHGEDSEDTYKADQLEDMAKEADSLLRLEDHLKAKGGLLLEFEIPRLRYSEEQKRGVFGMVADTFSQLDPYGYKVTYYPFKLDSSVFHVGLEPKPLEATPPVNRPLKLARVESFKSTSTTASASTIEDSSESMRADIKEVGPRRSMEEGPRYRLETDDGYDPGFIVGKGSYWKRAILPSRKGNKTLSLDLSQFFIPQDAESPQEILLDYLVEQRRKATIMSYNISAAVFEG